MTLFRLPSLRKYNGTRRSLTAVRLPYRVADIPFAPRCGCRENSIKARIHRAQTNYNQNALAQLDFIIARNVRRDG